MHSVLFFREERKRHHGTDSGEEGHLPNDVTDPPPLPRYRIDLRLTRQTHRIREDLCERVISTRRDRDHSNCYTYTYTCNYSSSSSCISTPESTPTPTTTAA